MSIKVRHDTGEDSVVPEAMATSAMCNVRHTGNDEMARYTRNFGPKRAFRRKGGEQSGSG